MIKDFFRFSFNTLRTRTLRTWLTIMGILIGITAIVALISLGIGMHESINYQFQKLGTNRIIIAPGGGFFGPGGGGLVTGNLTESDLKVVRLNKGVRVASGVLAKTVRVKYKDEVHDLSVWGFPTDEHGQRLVEQTGFLDVEKGRQLKQGDKYKAVLGNDVANEVFEEKIVPGSKITIEGKIFEVVGIQKKAGTGVHDNLIRIPLDVAREIFNEPEEFSTIFALTKSGEKVSEVAEDVKEDLRRHRGVKKGEEDFNVQTAEQTIARLNNILLAVTAAIVGIAAISLVVGGIGIMNTMYTAVLERTSEIGLMKAVGAKNSHILVLFLIESGFLGLFGGVIGILLGVLISKIGERLAIHMGATFFQSYFSVWFIGGVALFSFIVGVVSGVLPARQAAKLHPVEALRKK